MLKSTRCFKETKEEKNKHVGTHSQRNLPSDKIIKRLSKEGGKALLKGSVVLGGGVKRGK